MCHSKLNNSVGDAGWRNNTCTRLESAYILNWRDHQHSHHKAILSTVPDAPCNAGLPFPATLHWRDAKCTWSILLDKKVDTTGALERWCTAKWGPGNVGVWRELQCESTEHLREIDKFLFWIRRAWLIVWKGTIDYLPPIACDLIVELWYYMLYLYVH